MAGKRDVAVATSRARQPRLVSAGPKSLCAPLTAPNVGVPEIKDGQENAVNSKPSPMGAIVVGVDGSASSDLALDWAVDEATRRGLPLHIIHSFPHRSPLTRLSIGSEIDGLRELAAGVRKDAIARVDQANPALAVTW